MTPSLEITGLINPIVTAYKALDNEWKNLMEFGLNDYLHSQTEKYYFTNTFIHRDTKVVFKNIYHPIKAKYDALTTDFSDLDVLLTNYKNITLIGSAGCGKTTLTKHIFLSCIDEAKRIPILIELRHLNDYNGSIESLITEKIIKNNVKPSESIFVRELKSGKFLFLLDGYDEIFSEKKQEINRQLEAFVDSYSLNNFIITTRAGSGIESFPRFYDFHVQQLNNDDVISFVEKIVDDLERRKRILGIVNDKKNRDYKEYLRNPLLLSMFIMAFENHPEIPSRKTAFYRNVFDTLYSKHDGITKNSFLRQKITKLEREDFERILNVFSYLTLLKGEYAFTEEYLTDEFAKIKDFVSKTFSVSGLIYDLRTTISIFVLDGFEYKFPHRSLQEYFAAQFLHSLPNDRKLKGYNNVAENYRRYSNDGSFNFWMLCQELDKNDFKINFLIPQLKKILEDAFIESENELQKLTVFLSYFKPVLMSTKDGFEMGHYSTFITNFLSFVRCYLFNKIYHIWSTNMDELSVVAAKLSADLGSVVDFNEEMLLILLKNENTIILLEEQEKAIKDKIKELEDSVDNINLKIDGLLNI